MKFYSPLTGVLLVLLASFNEATFYKKHHSSTISKTFRPTEKDTLLYSYSDFQSKYLVRKGGAIQESGGGTATISNEIFNLVKSIVGAGVLSLSAGIAAYGNAPSSILPGMVLIAAIGAISGYGFSLIGRVCANTGAKTYREAWDKTVGPSTSWITAASSVFSCLIANLAYSMILADTFKNLLAAVNIQVSRSHTLFGVTALILIPLCLLKDLSSLAPFSLLGIIGMIYTAGAMTLRYFGGEYKVPNGRFVNDVIAKPSFGDRGAMSILSPNTFILLGMLSTGYMAHFAAPKFYVELKDNTIQRYNTVVSSSFGISIAIFCVVAAVGFLTFGSSSNGLILNNYSNKDSLISLSRVAVALSIVFSYPLVFVGTRDGLLDLANIPTSKRSDSLVNTVTLITIGLITVAALIVKDLSFVLSFGGATMGNALIYVFPTLMFRKMVQQQNKVGSGVNVEVYFATFTCLLGLVMGAIGTFMSIKSLSSN